MPIIVHKIDLSPPVRAVYMTAEILGLAIEKRDVDLLKGEHKSPEFVKKNPTHTVPVLEDGDFILSDSHAIITYLVSKYGADKCATLYPADLKTRAIIDHRLFLNASIIFPKLLAILIAILREKITEPTPQHIEDVIEAYGFVEKYLEGSEYLAGDYITVADISCVATLSSLDILVPISEEKFPKIMAWWKKIQGKEWYQKNNLKVLADLEQYAKSGMEKNASR